MEVLDVLKDAKVSIEKLNESMFNATKLISNDYANKSWSVASITVEM